MVGRPNVGKSTLTNALIGSKIAITSNRPETTRHNVRGVCTTDDAQIILVDTPGLHRPRTLLGKRLNDLVREALVEVDAVVFCLPANQKIGPGDRFIANELKELKCPVIVALTKCDLVSRQQVMQWLAAANQLGDWAELVPLSAKNNDLGPLVKVLAGYLPQSPPLYPAEQIADESVEKMIAELVREAALEGVEHELPHSIAVVVEEILYQNEMVGPQFSYGLVQAKDGAGVRPALSGWGRSEDCLGQALDPNADSATGGDAEADSDFSLDQDDQADQDLSPVAGSTSPSPSVPASGKPLDVHVNLYVERDSQKGIIIGKGGGRIRQIRIKSKRQIQKMLGCPINLEIHVRVAQDWQRNTKLLNRLGF